MTRNLSSYLTDRYSERKEEVEKGSCAQSASERHMRECDMSDLCAYDVIRSMTRITAST